MSRPFDAVSKYLMSFRPQDWLALLGYATDLNVDEVDTDVSTVSASCDKVWRVSGDEPFLVHVEVQSGRDQNLPVRTCRYGILLHYKHDLPVSSAAVLLSRRADGQELTGNYDAKLPDGTVFLRYRYQVVRVWEIPAEDLCHSGIGVLALAPIGKIEKEQLPAIIHEMQERVTQELPREEVNNFWTATALLMGLDFPLDLVQNLLRGVANVEESVFAQMLVEKGIEKGREKGIAEGIEKGIEKGIERGRVEGREKGIAEGIELAFERARREEAVKTLLWILRLQFGELNGSIINQINLIQNIDLIDDLKEAAIHATALPEFIAKLP